jgi:hypothetical protein
MKAFVRDSSIVWLAFTLSSTVLNSMALAQAMRPPTNSTPCPRDQTEAPNQDSDNKTYVRYVDGMKVVTHHKRTKEKLIVDDVELIRLKKTWTKSAFSCLNGKWDEKASGSFITTQTHIDSELNRPTVTIDLRGREYRYEYQLANPRVEKSFLKVTSGDFFPHFESDICVVTQRVSTQVGTRSISKNLDADQKFGHIKTKYSSMDFDSASSALSREELSNSRSFLNEGKTPYLEFDYHSSILYPDRDWFESIDGSYRQLEDRGFRVTNDDVADWTHTWNVGGKTSKSSYYRSGDVRSLFDEAFGKLSFDLAFSDDPNSATVIVEIKGGTFVSDCTDIRI